MADVKVERKFVGRRSTRGERWYMFRRRRAVGAFKKLDGMRREHQTETAASDLNEIAALLGGEIDNGTILCPSPGKSADDRSCALRISPTQPGSIFIYYCEGPLRTAYAAIRATLQISEPSPLANYERLRHMQRIWDETIPATDTIVERYLRSRAITVTPPPTLRFHPNAWHSPSKTSWPAMVAARTDRDNTLVAVHRTFLRHDGRGKAPVESERMDLGLKSGSAIRLSPVAEELLIGEGVETTLSVMQVTGRSGWAAGSAKDLAAIEIPDAVRSIIIVADGDRVGNAAANEAARRLIRECREVRIVRAPTGQDFNDILRAGG